MANVLSASQAVIDPRRQRCLGAAGNHPIKRPPAQAQPNLADGHRRQRTRCQIGQVRPAQADAVHVVVALQNRSRPKMGISIKPSQPVGILESFQTLGFGTARSSSDANEMHGMARLVEDKLKESHFSLIFMLNIDRLRRQDGATRPTTRVTQALNCGCPSGRAATAIQCRPGRSWRGRSPGGIKRHKTSSGLVLIDADPAPGFVGRRASPSCCAKRTAGEILGQTLKQPHW